jgi:outer membrane protein assembly factor BamB
VLIATDKETGKVAWETNMGDGQPDLELTAAPLPVKDKIVIGAAAGDRGVRDFIAALDGASGELLWRRYTVPARFRDLEGQQQRLADRRRRDVGDGLLRYRHQPSAVGHRQSSADVP